MITLDLSRAGYSTATIGLLLGLALGGAAAWAALAPRIDRRWGRRSIFAVSAVALAIGGFLLWSDLTSPAAVLAACLLGGVVSGGADVSPLGALEQATLATTSTDSARTWVFSLYNLLGYLGVAFGALAAAPIRSLTLAGVHPPQADPTMLLYGLLGLALVPAYLALSPTADGAGVRGRPTPLSSSSRPTVYSLTALFSVDAFAGGMIVNSLVVYYFSARYGVGTSTLGLVFFLSSLCAGLSLLAAAPLARRVGLVRTMVFTHIPSSAILILLILAPTFAAGAGLWIARSALSQMDVPTRQSYTQAVVPPDDRAAAAGYTTSARSAQAFGAPVTGALLAVGGAFLGAPFALAGTVKIGYDLAIYRRFRGLRPPEESD